jgi:RNA recognition motif-containing protein
MLPLQIAFAPLTPKRDCSVKIVRKKETGQSLGYGFIVFDIEYNALQAIQAMEGYNLQGRRIKVCLKSDGAAGNRAAPY